MTTSRILAAIVALCCAFTGATYGVPRYDPVFGFEAGPSRPGKSRLHLHADGNFYGTSNWGGAYAKGTIYRVSPSGEVTTLVHFTGFGGAAPGDSPNSELVSDSSGVLWGTTHSGSFSGAGTVFKFDPATGVFTNLVTFTGNFTPATRGDGPYGGLAHDGAGFLWGTTSQGGTASWGTIYKINIATGAMTVVADFGGSTSPSGGELSYAKLVNDGAGFFWGTTTQGGAGRHGNIFKVNRTTGVATQVVAFTNTGGAARGRAPHDTLVPDNAGFLWGTTSEGGALGFGTVYKVRISTGALTTVAEFTDTGAIKGKYPYATLEPDGLGNLWGVTTFGGAANVGTLFRINIATGALTTVAEFTGAEGVSRGSNPTSTLANAGNGFLWGNTSLDGHNRGGTIFKVEIATGSVTTVADLYGIDGNIVASPAGALVEDEGGNLWGASERGGSSDLGTVFRLNPATKALNWSSFTGGGPGGTGGGPTAGLIDGGDGHFWGTANGGGLSSGGTVFKVNKTTGAIFPVVNFTGTLGSAPGLSPGAGLVSDGNGWLWGTTQRGSQNLEGTVFKVNVATGAFVSVVQFTGTAGAARGSVPRCVLCPDGNGFLWGTTQMGGAANVGTIFRVEISTGALTVVRDFTGASGATPGRWPLAGLVLGTDGFLWGTTSLGGVADIGTIFKLHPVTGAFTKIMEFTNAGATKGRSPQGALTQDATGGFWGMTGSGGAGDFGTIFRVGLDGTFQSVFDFTDIAGPIPGKWPSYNGFTRTLDGHMIGTTRAGGVNAAGRLAGRGQVFRLRFGPIANTLAAEGVTPAGAKLRATIDPNGFETTVAFQIGRDPELAFPITHAAGTIAAAAGESPVAVDVDNLAPNTTYYYRAVATNAENPNPQHGPIRSFTTSPLTPPAGGALEIDATAPVAPGTAVVATFSGWTDAEGQLPLSFQLMLDGEALPNPGATMEFDAPTQDGVHTLTGRVYDAFGASAEVIRQFSVDAVAPVITGPFVLLTIDAGADGTAALPNYAAQATVTDAVGVVSVVQSPPAGSILPFGRHVVTLTAADKVGNASSIELEVTIGLNAPLVQSLSAKGQTVPGAGIDPRIAPDAIFTQLGVPAVSDDRSLAFLASWKANRRVQHGIFHGVQPALVVASGEDTPGIPGGRFRVLQHPLVAPDGSIAFRATAAGRGVHAGNDQGIWLRSAAGLQLLLREGAQIAGLPPAHVLHSVAGVSLRNGELLVLARLALRGNVVRENNDTVLLRVSAGGAAIVAREGALLDLQDGFPAVKVKSIRSLVPVPGSPAHGRWHADGAALVHVMLENERPVVLEIGSDGEIRRSLAMGDGIPNLPDSALWRALDSPAIAPGGHAVAIRGSLITLEFPGLPPVVDDQNDTILAYSDGASADFAMIAREGSDAPDAQSAQFATFQEPVVNDAGTVLFGATLGGLKITSANRAGLWWGPPGFLRLLARANGFVPGPDGESTEARWSRFTSYVLRSGPAGGPVFTAVVRGRGVTTRNSMGIWGVDSGGVLRQLLRGGDLVNGKPVVAIQALNSAPGTLGASRGYNVRGTIAARVQLAGGGIALVRIDIPDGVPPMPATGK